MPNPSNKDVLWESRPSHLVKTPFYLAGLIGILILGGLAYVLPSYYQGVNLPGNLDSIIGYLSIGGWVCAGLLALWVVAVAINHHYIRYVLTEDTLYTRANFWRGAHDTMWTYLIRDVRAELPLIMRIFGLGQVVIVGRDQSHPRLVLEGIRDARTVKGIINDLARVQGARHRVLSVGD